MRTKAGWALMSVLLALSLAPAAFAEDHASSTAGRQQLRGQIVYRYVGNLGITDSEGRTLVWEGTLQGDLDGTMKWWFGPAPCPTVRYDGGRVNYYAGRWELWNEAGDQLLLAGDSAGKTVTPGAPGAWGVGMWDGHGVVTFGMGRLAPLKGRHIYETGPVIPDPITMFSGTGIFTIH